MWTRSLSREGFICQVQGQDLFQARMILEQVNSIFHFYFYYFITVIAISSSSLSSSSLSLSSSGKSFNVAHYSKNIKDMNAKLKIIAHHDMIQLQDNGHNYTSCSFGVLPLLTLSRTNECWYRMQCSC